MKTLLLLTLAASVGHVLAESAIPQPYTRDRYDDTVADSPFALATPPADTKEEEAPPVNVLTNLYITGVSQLDGKDYIYVKDVSGESFKLIGTDPVDAKEYPGSPYIGVRALKVNWGTNWTVVSVTLTDGTHTREGVKFKEQAAPVMGQQPPGATGLNVAPNTGNRFPGGGRGPGGPPASVIPAGFQKTAVPTGVLQGGRTFTPGNARGAGTQSINGSTVPRPGGGFRGGNNNGATSTNTGGARQQRDRGPIRNGGR